MSKANPKQSVVQSRRKATAKKREVQSAANHRALNRPKLVEVIWRDCQTLDGWVCPPDAVEVLGEKRIIATVGYLIQETKDQLILTSSWEEVFGKICGTWGIPISQVVVLRTIESSKAAPMERRVRVAD